jgi:hypothetical protein
MESDRKGKKLEILGKYLERRKTIKIYTTIFEHSTIACWETTVVQHST